jgi:chromosome segregation ATPase
MLMHEHMRVFALVMRECQELQRVSMVSDSKLREQMVADKAEASVLLAEMQEENAALHARIKHLHEKLEESAEARATASDELEKVKAKFAEEEQNAWQLAHTCQELRRENSELQASRLSLERQCETFAGVDKVSHDNDSRESAQIHIHIHHPQIAYRCDVFV